MRIALFILCSTFYQLLLSQSSSLVDERDGNAYAIVQIGDQFWMQENLRYKHETGVYKRKRKLAKFGNFYNNKALEEICPEGWHVPTLTEWDNMLHALIKEKGIIESQIDTTALTEDFNIEIVNTQIVTVNTENLNLFEAPLNLKGFGWVQGGLRSRFLKTANLWVIDDIDHIKNYHLHIGNNSINSHHHKHDIEVKKRKRRHFNIRCVQ